MPYKNSEDLKQNKKDYYAKHKDRIKAYRDRRYREKHGEIRAQQREVWKVKGRMYKANRKIHRLASIYKTTTAVIEELLTITTCVLCNERPARDIDHCHKTGKIRGRLCRHCNVGLGHFNDDPHLLFKAVDYLMQDEVADGI